MRSRRGRADGRPARHRWPGATSEAAFTVATVNGRTIASVTNAEVRAPTPLNNAFWYSNQSAGGEADYGQVGLLPSWEAVYLRTGDVRALRAVLLNARQWQFIPTWRRDERTLRLRSAARHRAAVVVCIFEAAATVVWCC